MDGEQSACTVSVDFWTPLISYLLEKNQPEPHGENFLNLNSVRHHFMRKNVEQDERRGKCTSNCAR